MDKIKYYGAADLENPADGCCWYRAACPENTFTVQERCGKNIDLLHFDGSFSRKAVTRDKEKWKRILTFLVKELTEDIYGYCGEDIDSVADGLCMVCLVPCRAGAACLDVIREILKDMGVGQVRFVTKEIAAVMYMQKVQEFAKTGASVCVLLDAGERQGAVSVVQIQDKKAEILKRISCKECGAEALDSAVLGWLQMIFDHGFQKFKTDRAAFRTFFENWTDGRIFMKRGSVLNLNIGELDNGNLKEPAGNAVKIVSNGYTNRLALSADQLGTFCAEVFEKVWLLLEEGLGIAEKYDPKVQVIINGSYLSLPPLYDYLKSKGKEQAQECLLQSRTACMQGALAMMQGTNGWFFNGILKRTWGIVMLGQDKKQHFEVLLPGGRELPAGYEKRIYVMPEGNEKCLNIHFCSVPAGWRYGNDASLLSCEKSLQIISDNIKFPRRKVQVSIRVSEKLQLCVYDLVSAVRVCDEAEPGWERALDHIIEAEEETDGNE